jgi:hypothetical protein
MSAPERPISERIRAEIDRATIGEACAYRHGASRDGTFSRLHKTLRICQADTRWLWVLKRLLARLGKRAWIYREGTRNVWVIETTWRPQPAETIGASAEAAAFVRGYFDAEGGVPAATHDRFYIQLVQKSHGDLAHTHALLGELGVRCGRIHNPSARQDANYWRFYVRAASHRQFIQAIGSWHPRKRILLDQKELSLNIGASTKDSFQ